MIHCLPVKPCHQHQLPCYYCLQYWQNTGVVYLTIQMYLLNKSINRVVSRFLSSRFHPKSRQLFPFYFSNIMLRTDLLSFGVTGAVFKIACELRRLPAYFDNPDQSNNQSITTCRYATYMSRILQGTFVHCYLVLQLIPQINKWAITSPRVSRPPLMPSNTSGPRICATFLSGDDDSDCVIGTVITSLSS